MRYFGPQVQAAGAVLLVTTVVAVAALRRARGSAAVWSVLSAGVAVALLAMTTWPTGSDAPRRIQWVPLRTMAGQLENPELTLAVINLAGNVAVFVPLGFCLRMALRRAGRPAVAAVLLGTGVSVLAEVLQLAVGSRATDVDDVLLNALGVALGAGLGTLLVTWLRPSPGAGSAARMAGWSSPR